MNKYFATWSPRILTHFKEFLDFLNKKDPNPLVKFDEKVYSKLKDFTQIETIDNPKALKIIYPDVTIFLTSEGVILIEFKNMNNALKRYESLKEVLSYIYKAGMPIPSIMIRDFSPILIEISNKKPKKDWLLKGKDFSISINEIWTNKNNLTGLSYLTMVNFMIKLAELLINIHRESWEYINSIKSIPKLSAKDISNAKDVLIGYKHKLEYIHIRGRQMEIIYETFTKYNKNSILELVSKLDYYVKSLTSYSKELWRITYTYCKDAIKDLESLQWNIHQKELESIRTFALLYVIVALGELIVHAPLTFQEFIIFIFSSLVVAYIIQKVISLVSSVFYKVAKHNIRLKQMEESLKEMEEKLPLELLHLE